MAIQLPFFRAVAAPRYLPSLPTRRSSDLSFLEQTAQRVADSSHVLITAAAWTYWNSEFTVITIALLWVYLRRHEWLDRKSTRLNSSHPSISYAVFCLKTKTI